MSAFGDPLKETREARGLSLEALAEATRIARHHLAALERSDIAALPAGPFAKGYIEACAKVLGIDSRPILEAYRDEAQKRGLDSAGARSRTLDELGQLVKKRSGTAEHSERRAVGWKGLTIASSAAVFLAIAGWLATRDRTPADPVATAPRPPAPASLAGAVAPEAATPTAATPQPAASVANPNIEISDSGVGTGIENHRLVGAGERFPEGSEVVFWTRVSGGRPGNVIQHVWLHEGRGIARIRLTIGGSPFRTYSRRPLPRGAAGRWTVEARNSDGSLLARREFLCVPRER